MAEWLAKALLGVAAAAAGYVGKAVVEWYRERRTAHRDTLRQLRQLAALLDEGRSVFQSQIYLANELLLSVRANHADKVSGLKGYDETFAAAYDAFSEKELELHALIRSMTMHPMLRVNKAVKEWLDNNIALVEDLPATSIRDHLRLELGNLTRHLNEWFSKYEALLPSDKKRSVIFVADEKKHGTRFPQDLRPILANVINNFTA